MEGQDEEESTWLRPWSRTKPEVDLLLWKVVEFSPMSRETAALSNLLGSQQERRARSGVEGVPSSAVEEPSLLALDAQVKATLVLFRWVQRCQCTQGHSCELLSRRSLVLL